MCILNRAYFKGTANELQDCRTTIQCIAVGSVDVVTYTDRVGKDHLYMEFETDEILGVDMLRPWQQLDMTLKWLPLQLTPGAEWTKWIPALQRANARWKL
jgi:hypothetical protein